MVPNHHLNTALARAQIDERRHDADQERAARRARRAYRGSSGAVAGATGAPHRPRWLRHLAHAIMGAAP